MAFFGELLIFLPSWVLETQQSCKKLEWDCKKQLVVHASLLLAGGLQWRALAKKKFLYLIKNCTKSRQLDPTLAWIGRSHLCQSLSNWSYYHQGTRLTCTIQCWVIWSYSNSRQQIEQYPVRVREEGVLSWEPRQQANMIARACGNSISEWVRRPNTKSV